ncbi:MAG TPA: sugar transferase [Candidatus Scybalomonas excrementigallinarum]|nr:sugar transferase [Candidatus Scybalomonas excrementigallinarum]
MYLKYGKRIIDFILAFIAFIAFSWLFLLIAAAIKVTSRGSIFFRQRRVGCCGKQFYILKFRTMKIDTPKDVPTHLLKDPEQYITRVGKFLRKTSLDELPQLINILYGQMAIVGPRPALWNQKDLLQEREKYGANDIRPGLTGWAQVNGRDELQIMEKARLDGIYVKKMGFFFDLGCILKTIQCVLKHKGVKEGGTKGI